MIILRWSISFIINDLLCSPQYFQQDFDFFGSDPVVEGDSAQQQNTVDPITMDQQPMDDFGDMMNIQVR